MAQKPSKTITILKGRLTELEQVLTELDNKRKDTLDEINEIETAINAIDPKASKQMIRYQKDTSFRQKVIYCLKSKNELLSVKTILLTLTEVDADLKKDLQNTGNSLRTTMTRMIQAKEIIRYKTDNLKAVHYGLAEWWEGKKIKQQYKK